MNCTQNQFSDIRAAVRKAFYDARDSYLWYAEHDPGNSMVGYYRERYERYAALRDLFIQATELSLTLK